MSILKKRGFLRGFSVRFFDKFCLTGSGETHFFLCRVKKVKKVKKWPFFLLMIDRKSEKMAKKWVFFSCKNGHFWAFFDHFWPFLGIFRHFSTFLAFFSQFWPLFDRPNFDPILTQSWPYFLRIFRFAIDILSSP